MLKVAFMGSKERGQFLRQQAWQKHKDNKRFEFYHVPIIEDFEETIQFIDVKNPDILIVDRHIVNMYKHLCNRILGATYCGIKIIAVEETENTDDICDEYYSSIIDMISTNRITEAVAGWRFTDLIYTDGYINTQVRKLVGRMLNTVNYTYKTLKPLRLYSFTPNMIESQGHPDLRMTCCSQSFDVELLNSKIIGSKPINIHILYKVEGNWDVLDSIKEFCTIAIGGEDPVIFNSSIYENFCSYLKILQGE